jgi:hypothetical protein
VSASSDLSPYGVEYWATQSMQERSDQRALMTDHIRRTQVRFWLSVAALIGVFTLSLGLESIRHLAGEVSISGWRTVAGMVPGLLSLAAVLGISAAFVRDAYDLPDWRAALGRVRLLLFGRAPLSLFDLKPRKIPMAPYPAISVRQGGIDEKHADALLARLGGPGNVTIFNDSAAFLERFGRFTRVAGPGKVFLRRFERIRETLDLRPQERSSVAKAMTKDGIPVQAEVQVRFQLARPPASLVPPTPDVPHPVYEWALTRAGQCHSRTVKPDSGEESVSHWDDQVGVGGAMRKLVAQRRLDELLEPHEPERVPHREISQALYEAADKSARDVGAQVLEVRVGALEPTSEEVKKERISSWQAGWTGKARKEKAQGEAEAIRERGLARAYAQMEIILSLAREFQDAVERNVAPPAEIIILRFMEALRQTWSSAGADSVSSQVFKMWEALQESLERLIGPNYRLPGGETGVSESPGGQE